VLLNVVEVGLVVLKGGALQVERVLVVVHDLEHGHVLWQLLCHVELLLEALIAFVRIQRQVVARAHDHGLARRL